MADQIVLMDHGVIQQEAAPVVIYNDPNNVFTSQFIGTPPMNVLDMPDGRKIGFRPEKIRMGGESEGGKFRRKAKIITREMLGSETLYKVALGDDETIMIKSPNPDFEMGQQIAIGVAEKDLYFFDKNGTRIRSGLDSLILSAGGMSDA